MLLCLLVLWVASSAGRPSSANVTLSTSLLDELSTAKATFTNSTPIYLYYLPITWESHPEDAYQPVDCDVPCSYAGGVSEVVMGMADAVLFHLPMFSSKPQEIMQHMGAGSRKIYTVGLSMEPSGAYPEQFEYVSSFDIEMSFRLTSDVPMVYFGFWRDILQPIIEYPWEQREPAVLFMASHCSSVSGREKLVGMLQEHVRVDSISKCLNNQEWPSDIPRSDKLSVLRRYMVYLAAENSAEQDYVSEKVYDGLIAGAVPIYLGAPNVDEFVPKGSVITIPANFTNEDVARVAGTIRKIFTNKQDYMKRVAFKQHPLEDELVKRFNFTHIAPKCRLCRRIFADRNGFHWNHQQQIFILS